MGCYENEANITPETSLTKITMNDCMEWEPNKDYFSFQLQLQNILPYLGAPNQSDRASMPKEAPYLTEQMKLLDTSSFLIQKECTNSLSL